MGKSQRHSMDPSVNIAETSIQPEKKEFSPQLFGEMVGKASDLDWFMFENKVREIIGNLVEPL
jgi:septation ring formation regulator EzrA